MSELVQPSKQPRKDDFAKCAMGIVIPLFASGRGSEPPIAESLQTSALLRLLSLRILYSMRTAVDSTVRRCKTVAVQVQPGARHLTQVIEISLTAVARSARITSAWITAFLKRAPHRWFRARLTLPLPFVSLIFLATPPVAYLAYCAATLPFAGPVFVQRPPGILVLKADNNREFARRGVFVGERISAHDLPTQLESAVIAIEDRRFYSHPGVALRSTIRAAWHDLLGGRLQGGSTITQQLARMSYLSPERTLKRKVQEALLAIWLEHTLSKQEILARYLDRAYFGDGVYGADAAAKHYFGKSAKAL